MFNYKPSDWKMDNTQLKRAAILKTPVTQKYDVGAVLGSYAPPTIPYNNFKRLFSEVNHSLLHEQR